MVSHWPALSGGLAIAATQACVQAFRQASPVGLRAVNEYTADLARLILLPAARLLRQEAWEDAPGTRRDRGAADRTD